MAIYGHFVAISESGGAKLVDQSWTKLRYIRGDVLRPFSGS